jgi:hypothetical protein
MLYLKLPLSSIGTRKDHHQRFLDDLRDHQHIGDWAVYREDFANAVIIDDDGGVVAMQDETKS